MRLTDRELAIIRERFRRMPTSILIRFVTKNVISDEFHDLMRGIGIRVMNDDLLATRWCDKVVDARGLAAVELDERIPTRG